MIPLPTDSPVSAKLPGRYAIVGLGSRAEMYLRALLEDYRSVAELAALCDSNPGRLDLALQLAQSKGCHVPGYCPSAFADLLRISRPDTVIVTCMDRDHDFYIMAAMEAGWDVITEKPMTIDPGRCTRILESQRRTGRRCRVAFNYRYSPVRSPVKELLLAKTIGEVLSVDFHCMLDTHHGTDYFRRWHRRKENSGGLLVHKSTHHFDLVNWWLADVPESVMATGHCHYATPAMADRLGLALRGDRCLGCAEAKKCPYFFDLAANPNLRELYLEQENHDGYHRDQCVFSADTDIEDSMQVLVRYASGVPLAYSLNAFCAWEGYTIAFNGTLGQLEHKCEESVYVSGDDSIPGALKPEGTFIRVYPLRSPAYTVPLQEASGGHGGGDELLLRDMFQPGEPDMLGRVADQRGGTYSILCGIAANQSLQSRDWVQVADLVRNLDLPD